MSIYDKKWKFTSYIVIGGTEDAKHYGNFMPLYNAEGVYLIGMAHEPIKTDMFIYLIYHISCGEVGLDVSLASGN